MKQTDMIENELLPGCAILVFPKSADMADKKEWIYNPEFNDLYYGHGGIPITADTVSRVDGLDDLYNHKISFESLFGEDFISVTFNGHRIKHITSIHQLQILIYSLTGTMPKYEIR